MKAVKRIEIIIPAVELNHLIRLLDKHDMPGYTVIRTVTGKGHRGVQDGAGLTTAFTNSYVMVACSEEEMQGLIEPLRSLLHRVGGVCLASDAMWLIH